MFLSYYKLFESDIADVLIRGKEFLSYIGWQKLVSKVQDEDQIIHRLADKYERQGEKLPADELRKQLIRMEVSRKFPGARSLDPQSAAYRLYLESVFVERGDTRSAWEIYKKAIMEDPFNYAFWHGYCRMSIANNMKCSEAIAYCKKYLDLSHIRSNRAPLMALANLYAANGDYGSAINVYAEYMDNLTDQEEQWVISLTKEEHYQIPMLNGGLT
jgi:tetratricopeptide (TPR) repeat protein